MNDMNLFIASGRATSNAVLDEISTTAGSKFGKLTFAMATNSSYKNTKGESVPQVQFHNCVKTYNFLDNGHLPKHAYDMRDMIQKGRKVLIRGQINTRTFKSDKYPDLTQSRTEVNLNGFDSHIEVVNLPPRVDASGQPITGNGKPITESPYTQQSAPEQEVPASPEIEQQLDEKPF